MVQEIPKLGLQIIGLILLQFLVFNNINFLGYINPYPYIFILLLYRLDGNPALLLLVAFLAGFLLDLTLQTPGAHTIALLISSFLRPNLCQFTIGVNAEYASNVFESGARTAQQLNFLAVLILVHHLSYFIVIFFSWTTWSKILIHTLSSGLFTFLILWLTLLFYQKRR